MGLREAFKKAAVAAFVAAGNLKEEVTYRSKTEGSAGYTPSSGAVSDPYTDYGVQMLFMNYKQEQIDGKAILPIDEMAMIPVDNLAPIPKLNDLIIRTNEDGTNYTCEVQGPYEKDPARALYVLHTRPL
jgi:hypothetical protein